jgi:succinate dehydrogenase / fumarate reductase, membrane anchor subunit
MTDMRTPLGRVRGLGSAREGTIHFWRQRLTAIANVPLVLFMVGLMVALVGAPYEDVRATLANPFVTLVVILFLVSVLYHMKLGMQIVIEDYVQREGGADRAQHLLPARHRRRLHLRPSQNRIRRLIRGRR